jgi:hypothetical protein
MLAMHQKGYGGSLREHVARHWRFYSRAVVGMENRRWPSLFHYLWLLVFIFTVLPIWLEPFAHWVESVAPWNYKLWLDSKVDAQAFLAISAIGGIVFSVELSAVYHILGQAGSAATTRKVFRFHMLAARVSAVTTMLGLVLMGFASLLGGLPFRYFISYLLATLMLGSIYFLRLSWLPEMQDSTETWEPENRLYLGEKIHLSLIFFLTMFILAMLSFMIRNIPVDSAGGWQGWSETVLLLLGLIAWRIKGAHDTISSVTRYTVYDDCVLRERCKHAAERHRVA